MSEPRDDMSRYTISFEHAQGTVIGDGNRVEQHFHVVPPTPTRGELLAAIRGAGAELRAYPSEIAGIHVDRVEVGQIVEWLQGAGPDARLGVLLDQPGSGKTVVMRDVLIQLEAADVPVLAIKADTLSGVHTRDELRDRLKLPLPVEACVQHLQQDALVVVLVDQLDALSLALSRDQAALDVLLSSLAQLREYPNVRLLASCRTFDLHTDPRLSGLRIDQRFHVQPLGMNDVERVLQTVEVAMDNLLPSHRSLLTVPLHLSVYVDVVREELARRNEAFHSLQGLYDALWRVRIETSTPGSPSPEARRRAVYHLVDSLRQRRQLTAPAAVLDEHVEAATYLERTGFIRREHGHWLFMHQTLFDYAYARRFIGDMRSISQEVLASSQGLFERSQMVQILAYMRGLDHVDYPQELVTLLSANNLRFHLKLLLLGWLGSLPTPTPDERRVVNQLSQNADDQVRFLQAASSNLDWFEVLCDNALPALLGAEREASVDGAVRYLTAVVDQRTDQVLALLRPKLGTSAAWDARISHCLSHLIDWRNGEALAMAVDLARRGRLGRMAIRYFSTFAKAYPVEGCQVLRAYLDRRLDELIEREHLQQLERQIDPNAAYRDGDVEHGDWGRYLLDEAGIGELVERTVEVCPHEVVEHLLPWFVRAARAASSAPPSDDSYAWDPVFAWGWYGSRISEGPSFARHMAAALAHIASGDAPTFRARASELATVEALAVQRVLLQAYLVDPAAFADDLFDYLAADRRRFRIGEPLEAPVYDSGQALGAVFPYLSDEQRARLEQLIMDWTVDVEPEDEDYRSAQQLQLLKSISPDLLSESTVRKRQELEQRFPSFEVRPPVGIRTGSIVSPILPAEQEQLDDDAWLAAMRTYNDTTERPGRGEDLFKGGILELAQAYVGQVQRNPERFYRLAQSFDETISLQYISATIAGLADSDGPSEWLFELIRTFSPRLEGDARRGVCTALEKRAEAGVPDDLIRLLASWATHDLDPDRELWQVLAVGMGQPYYGGDPLSHGINTVRGSALQAVCRCALARQPAQVEVALTALEHAARDSSTAVRACAVDTMRRLLPLEPDRVITLFVQALESQPHLLQTPVVHDFLYWAYRRDFARVRPVLEALLSNDDDETRQAGGRLACLAALQFSEAHDLAEPVLSGDAAMRRGAAQVYARNLEFSETEAVCRAHLEQLMVDPDADVRAYVGECFAYTREVQINTLRDFIHAFLQSPALLSKPLHLINYLKPLAVYEHDLALQTVEAILDAVGAELVDIRTEQALLEEDIARLPLAVYTRSRVQETQSHAMHLFERLLNLGSWTARDALTEWDRR